MTEPNPAALPTTGERRLFNRYYCDTFLLYPDKYPLTNTPTGYILHKKYPEGVSYEHELR